MVGSGVRGCSKSHGTCRVNTCSQSRVGSGLKSKNLTGRVMNEPHDNGHAASRTSGPDTLKTCRFLPGGLSRADAPPLKSCSNVKTTQNCIPFYLPASRDHKWKTVSRYLGHKTDTFHLQCIIRTGSRPTHFHVYLKQGQKKIAIFFLLNLRSDTLNRYLHKKPKEVRTSCCLPARHEEL